MTRTSHSHPLWIDTIQVGKGQLGLSLCPGKIQPHAQTGSWNRDLDTDLDAVTAWGAGTIITLLEQDEIEALSVPRLGERTLARGLD